MTECEEKWRSLVENAPNYILIVDRDGTIEFINRVEPGVSVEETIGKPIYDYIGPEDHNKVRETIEHVFETGEMAEYQSSVTLPDGRRWKYITRVEPIKHGGQVVSAMLISTDITERKQAEEALRENEERLSRFINSATDQVYLFDSELNLVEANPAALEILGRDRETALGKHILVLSPRLRETGRYDEYRKVVKTGNPYLADDVLSLPDFKRMWLTVRAFKVGDGLGIIVTDITERRQAEQKLQAYQAQLRSLASELTMVEERERRRIATELHDRIGQTLVFAKMKLGELQTCLPAAATDKLADMQELIDRVISEIRSLTFELSPPVLYELGLEAALEWLTERIEEQHGIKIELHDDGQSKPLGKDTRALLFRAVQELLVNVAKHADASHARVSVWRERDSIRIRVEDNGVGFFSDEVLPCVDERDLFGLFSIQERVAELGGEFEIKSSPGEGTQATLVIPVIRTGRAKRGG